MGAILGSMASGTTLRLAENEIGVKCFGEASIMLSSWSRSHSVGLVGRAAHVALALATVLATTAAYNVVGTLPARAATVTVTTTDLGSLGGSSQATAVDGSVVVGYSYLSGSSGARHAFAYDFAAPSPHMIDLGTLGGTVSQAQAVSSGLVVGQASTSGDAENHAFAYDLGSPSPQMVDLGTLGGAHSAAYAVDGKVIVGFAWNSAGVRHAFA